MMYFIILICYLIQFVTGDHHFRNKVILDPANINPDIDMEPERQALLLKKNYTTLDSDPQERYKAIVQDFLVGPSDIEAAVVDTDINDTTVDFNDFIHYPSGDIMRSELFFNESGVHLPIAPYMHRGHCRLKITSDHMQTAVNAFSILIEGNLIDVSHLPPEYILASARTIAMMKLPQEKYMGIWTVVKNGSKTEEIPYTTLEMYRPLFKYVNAKEIARLNLSDSRILSYIGTHPDLNRHQVGAVASAYIQLNEDWMEPTYLNLMNNILCGVPMTYMRKITPNTYLQLTHQVFFHIRACDPLQRRFYLATMTRTQALGKSFSWSARDVSRLGLLLAEVEGPDLGAINPEAMSGISSQIMLQIPPQNLVYITDMQRRYIDQKSLNILVRKLKKYQDKVRRPHNKGFILVNKISFRYIVFLVYAIKM